MTYKGRVQDGVIIFDCPQRPPEGAMVRVVEEEPTASVGQQLDALAGLAKDLPKDLAKRHDHYRGSNPVRIACEDSHMR